MMNQQGRFIKLANINISAKSKISCYHQQSSYFQDFKWIWKTQAARREFSVLATRGEPGKNGTKMVPFCSDTMLTMLYYSHDAQHAQHDLKPARRGIRFYFNRLGR
jgi:hypothetical protein